MERKVHTGNKWWKIMRIYSKEMKTTKKTCRRCNERKQGGEGTITGRGEGGWEKKIQRQ
jgi:hypothetical protein